MKTSIEPLAGIANQLRIHSIQSTTAAGSGHVTSCCSAAELIATLFFAHMRFNPKDPRDPNNDRFVLSKGHAAPILYAAWAEAGLFPVEELKTLREIDSALEGHPVPRAPFVDVATGSLGQGLSCGAGMALAARFNKLEYRTYVLLGDGECAEGSVWEAASFAGLHKLNHLVAVVDVNRLGQSQPTAFGHDLEVYRARFAAFGWRCAVIDGHDLDEIQRALDSVGQGQQPYAILAKTIKGKGLAVADLDDWHGKPLSEEEARKAVAELQPHAHSAAGFPISARDNSPVPERTAPLGFPPMHYDKGQEVATRKAYGAALARIGEVDERIIALDGDVKNSTYSQEFFKKFPGRAVECFISEQNMIGMAAGLAARGLLPFCSTFAAFCARACDQIRMAGISLVDLKICGSHAGVSIGEDGPSQMGLEDIAMMRAVPGSAVLHPCDAVSTEKLVEQMARTRGIVYLRTARPKTPVIYDSAEEFPIGGAKILKQGGQDELTVVATGVAVHEALRAAELLEDEGAFITVIDAYSVKPLAADVIRTAARRTNNTIVTVEDHYAEGGLGDAVAGELSQHGIRVHKLAVHELSRSGKPAELLARHGIDAAAIVEKVSSLIESPSPVREEPFLKGGPMTHS